MVHESYEWWVIGGIPVTPPVIRAMTSVAKSPINWKVACIAGVLPSPGSIPGNKDWILFKSSSPFSGDREGYSK